MRASLILSQVSGGRTGWFKPVRFISAVHVRRKTGGLKRRVCTDVLANFDVLTNQSLTARANQANGRARSSFCFIRQMKAYFSSCGQTAVIPPHSDPIWLL